MIEADELYDLALKTFGVEHEINITVGEIGEFLTCIGRKAQGRLTDEEMIDEIADVKICIEQMARIYGKESVEARMKEKIKKKLDHIQRKISEDNDEQEK